MKSKAILVVFVLSFSTTVYAEVVTFSSDATISDGDFYDMVVVENDGTIVDMTGGMVNGLKIYDSSQFNMYEGWLGEGDTVMITAYDTSAVNIFRGFVGIELSSDVIQLYGASTLNVDMDGGWIGSLNFAYDASVVNIYKGDLNHLGGYDSSTINIYGGDIGGGWGFQADISSTVNIFGHDFVYNPQAWWSDEFNSWISELTGVGPDGTPIRIEGIDNPHTSANINLIPEPSTLLLLGLGAMVLRKR